MSKLIPYNVDRVDINKLAKPFIRHAIGRGPVRLWPFNLAMHLFAYFKRIYSLGQMNALLPWPGFEEAKRLGAWPQAFAGPDLNWERDEREWAEG